MAQPETHGKTAPHPAGYLGAQDTYGVSHIKGTGKIYPQIFIDIGISPAKPPFLPPQLK
ncbi:hypothetical protein ACGVWS_09005 [Enterobacteriaceae bacterium LUAb1]